MWGLSAGRELRSWSVEFGGNLSILHFKSGIGAGGYSDLHELTAHNSFVLVLAETGIVGFTVWLAIVGYCFRMMLAIVDRGDDIIDDVPLEVPDEVALKDWKTDKALSLCLLLSLTGFFTAAFFLSRSYVVILYLLVALVVWILAPWYVLLAFAISAGLFAGASIVGSFLEPDSDWNAIYYGPGATAKAIAIDRKFSNPGGEPLRKFLAKW